MIPET